ncbi:MAG: DUF4214 domain-containing protein [Clostridiales bacterium]|nr:DUF4214 domain-containing protein [Clostridiales bacterium]
MKKLVSAFAAASLAFGVISVNSLADEVNTSAPVIELGDNNSAELDLTNGDHEAWYKITPNEYGIYSFLASANMQASSVSLDLFDDSGNQIDQKEADTNQVHGYYGPAYVEHLLTAGETYYIHIYFADENTVFSGNTLRVNAMIFSRAYQLKDHEAVTLGAGDITVPVEISNGNGSDITLSIVPSAEIGFGEGQLAFHNYSIQWIGGVDPSTKQPQYLTTERSCRVNNSRNGQYTCMISGYGDDYDDGMITIPFDIVFENNLMFTCDPFQIYGIHDGASVDMTSGAVADDAEGFTYFWRGNCFNDITPEVESVTATIDGFDFFEHEVCDKYSNHAYRGGAVINVDNGDQAAIEINTDTTVSLADSSAYKVFTYTPAETGSYTFSSAGVEGFMPFYAVFDPDLNLVAGSSVTSEFGTYLPQSLRTDMADFSTDLSLTAGKTYYLVVKVIEDGGEFTVKLSHEFAPTDTPTPTSAETTPTAAPTPETGVAGFVERLYTIALDRPSDPVGKADWIAAVTERGQTGADVARGFLYSPEFLNKDVSNEDFVRTLYRTFFDREPDTEGYNAWVAALNNGTPKQEIIEGFINSTEWANLCLWYGIKNGGTGVPNITVEPNDMTIGFCRRLYTTCLCRDAEQDGLMAWARQLANQRDSGTGAAHGFFFSNEFINQNVSNEEYVTRLYRTFMDREPEAAGYEAWVAQLNNGVSREEVFRGFAQSVEFARICTAYGIIREL